MATIAEAGSAVTVELARCIISKTNFSRSRPISFRSRPDLCAPSLSPVFGCPQTRAGKTQAAPGHPTPERQAFGMLSDLYRFATDMFEQRTVKTRSRRRRRATRRLNADSCWEVASRR
jgi:hypothetical protein